MNKKRQLSDEEKEAWNIRINNMEKNLKYLNYRIAYWELMINTGLDEESEKQKSEMRKLLSQAKTDVGIFKSNIDLGMSQIKKGVDKIPKSRSKKVKPELQAEEVK